LNGINYEFSYDFDQNHRFLVETYDLIKII